MKQLTDSVRNTIPIFRIERLDMYFHFHHYSYAKFPKTYGNFSLFMLLIDNLPFFGAAIFFSHVIRTNLILTAKQLGLSKNRQSVPLKIPKKKFHFSMFVSQTQDK